jgi:macrolide transport system ATP-binding/permease protein
MRWLRVCALRVAGLFVKNRRDQEFAAELESHLQLHIDDNARSGMSAQEARRQALLKLGGVEPTKEIFADFRCSKPCCRI